MTLSDLIHFALDEGMNLEWLLRASQLDKSTFEMKLADNAWLDEERKQIKLAIKEWSKK